ncbi:C4-dicarboxylate ABC transporter permease [Rhodobacterales bacterium HKCCE3408]|nr:C4-dicarboxylate ABC transporter permease [Rhodobacterales bacterium HKCCE3408]
MDFILWVLQNIALSPYRLGLTIANPQDWLFWENREALARFIYYGGSVEFFFVVFTTFLIITILGMVWRRQILWAGVRTLEGVANTVGRIASWAGLLMVLQQVMIVFLQRVFRVPDISLGPLGTAFTQDLSWWAEELKLYNAAVVCLCVSYTFVQGGHVRVDLVYAGVKYRTKRVIDMFGCLFFMMPVITLTYLYAWFFMWRHLVVPNPSASTDLERMIATSRVMRWNVETIGFSPNGFNAYFIFKVLIVIYCVLVFLQAVAFFWRSYCEWIEGEEAEGRYLDKDSMGDESEDLAHELHSGST